MNIIVIGANGQLGKCLQAKVGLLSLDDKYIFYSKNELNINDYALVRERLIDFKPKIIINVSGYTNVDAAENEQKKSIEINCLAVKNLADLSAQMNATLIHISTDYVFNGEFNNPYKETDQTGPKTVYGKTKLAGEAKVISSGCEYVIIRTSWVFSEHGNNFMKTILRLMKEKKSIGIVDDQIGCPTYAYDIASIILSFVKSIGYGATFKDIYHFSGNERMTWFCFAQQIYNEQIKVDKSINCNIQPLKTSQYKTEAQRPNFSVLDCSKIDNLHKKNRTSINDAIFKVINSLKSK